LTQDDSDDDDDYLGGKQEVGHQTAQAAIPSEAIAMAQHLGHCACSLVDIISSNDADHIRC